jgi:hypothetical protein
VTVPHLRRWLPVAVYILVPSVLILPLLFSGKTLYGADMFSVFHYSRIAIADAFRSGRLPVWDPHVMAGFPMLAEPQNAIFYPPTWFCVFLSAGTFWILSAWAHLILAGVFAHRWLERGLGLNVWSALAGACLFMISGYICGHVVAGHVNYVWAYPWIPAVLWRLERFLAGPTLRRGLLLSLVLSMLFLAGVPQYVHFVGLLVFVRLVHFILATREGRKARAIQAGRAIAWLTLGLAFCAPQLFPTLELVGQMQRGRNSNTSYFVDFSLNPRQLGELLFPPSRQPSQWWETCGFVGGAVLLLTLAMHAGKHPQRHLWSGIAGLSLILALGNASPFYDNFVAVVPGAGWFRGPGRYLLLFTVAMAGMAGMGFEALWNRGSAGFRILGGALSLASLVQLIVFAHPCFVEQKQFELQFSGGLQAELRNRCGLEGRVANGAVPDIGRCQVAGIDHVGGYEPMMLRRYAEALNAARGAATDIDMVIVASVAPHPVVQMLSVQVWLGRGWNIDREPNVRRIESESMPRSWLVNNAVVIEEKDELLRTIGFKKWDPRKTVLLESYPSDAPPVPTEKAAGRSRVLVKKPGYYEIEAENDADAYLVLSEAWYPGWRAEVDGRAVDVLPANHLIQTVRLPAGKHVVRFEYRSRFLGLGFAVAALAALVPVGFLVRRHRRQLPLERLPGAP